MDHHRGNACFSWWSIKQNACTELRANRSSIVISEIKQQTLMHWSHYGVMPRHFHSLLFMLTGPIDWIEWHNIRLQTHFIGWRLIGFGRKWSLIKVGFYYWQFRDAIWKFKKVDYSNTELVVVDYNLPFCYCHQWPVSLKWFQLLNQPKSLKASNRQLISQITQ